MLDKNKLVLYAITDRKPSDGANFFKDAQNALSGGVTMLQLREKNISDREYTALAVKLKKLCREFNAPLIINDNVKVCAAADADGVHLGQNDMDAYEARKLLGANKIIGVTAKTVSQAISAEKKGADYLGSGAVFGTSTKPDAVKMELDTLKSICASVNIPVVAIGGINADNVLALSGSGICGAAVVSGIFGSDDKKAAAAELKRKIINIL